jgi:hypothetical protein
MNKHPDRMIRYHDFGAWSGTPVDFATVARDLMKLAGPRGQFHATVVDHRGRRRVVEDMREFAEFRPKTPPKSVLMAVESQERANLELCFGEHGFGGFHEGQEEEGYYCGGSRITAIGAGREVDDILRPAVEIVGERVPWWARLRLGRPMSPLQLTNLAGLVAIGVGMATGILLAGFSAGLFFGLLISLALVLISTEVAGDLLPAFEIHGGTPRWNRRKWIVVVIPFLLLTTAAAIRWLLVLPALRP